MTRFDSIVVGNDLVSEHWLAEQFPAAVAAMRVGWKEREEFDKTTPRSGLTALASRFGADLVKAREQGDDALLRSLHEAVREALLLPGEEIAWTGGRADTTIAAVAPRTPSGTPPLLVLQAHDAATVEDLLDGEGAGRLLHACDGRRQGRAGDRPRDLRSVPGRRAAVAGARHGRRLAAAGRAGALAGGPLARRRPGHGLRASRHHRPR